MSNNTNMAKTKMITFSAILTALSIVYISFMPTLDLQVWSFTPFSHIFIMIGAFISPYVGFFTAIGTFLGFVFKGSPPFVLMRAGSHVFFVLYLVIMLKKIPLKPFGNVLFLNITTAIVHAVFEVLAVYVSIWLAFPGVNSDTWFIFTVVGGATIAHSIVDFFAGYYVYGQIKRSILR